MLTRAIAFKRTNVEPSLNRMLRTERFDRTS